MTNDTNTNGASSAASPLVFNRVATGSNPALGPLQTLVNGNTWVGDTGFNLMVVPSPLGTNNSGFIVMISQLFETHSFEAVPAPVPNRSLNNGTEQIGAVKYVQAVAENRSKFILHEETGMWLNQTVGTNLPTTPRTGLEAVNGEPYTSYVNTNPVIRSGTVPHGNTFQAAGVWLEFPNTSTPAVPQANVIPFLQLSNYPNANGQLNFLPTYTDGSDPSDLQAAYKTEIQAALTRIGSTQTVEEFINPVNFLNAYAKNIISVDSLPITTADNCGAVINIPFERAVAGPQEFVCTFMIEKVATPGFAQPNATDETPFFYQLQYLQSIPLLFPKGFNGKDVLFPHWNVNTLIAI